MTARVKTRFVVRRGRMGVPLLLRENFRGRGAKIEYVPVPVLQVSLDIGQSRSINGDSPIRSTLAGLENFSNEVKVLVLLMVDRL